MYMRHRHMVCGKFYICHNLDLDQNLNGNAYQTPLLHEALYVNHKIIMLLIGWYHNIFSHICVQHQNYPEHDTLCLSIFFYWIFSCPYLDQWLHVYDAPLTDFFWNCLARLKSFFGPQYKVWLILSKTTWCISSNASEGIYFGIISMIVQLFYVPITGQ